jgi:hypothetical protein
LPACLPACLPAFAEDGPLDFTDGDASQATITTADLNQRSLIDVEEDVSYDDEGTDEDEAGVSRAEVSACLPLVCAAAL